MNYDGKICFAENSQTFDGKSWYADVSKLTSLGFSYKYNLYSALKNTLTHWL